MRELKEQRCLDWRERHRNASAAITEEMLQPPMVNNVAGASVVNGCCITLLANLSSSEPDVLGDVVKYSTLTFISAVAFTYAYCMCKGPQEQESKSRGR